MEAARATLLAPAPETNLTTGQWLRFWLKEKERTGGASTAGRKVAATTARGYTSHLELDLIPALGAIPAAPAGTGRHRRALRELEERQDGRPRPLSPASVRRIYATLRSALNVAVKQQRSTATRRY